MKLFFIIAFALISITGCSTNESIKVVDPEGNPIKGALVISEQIRYIAQPWVLGVYITGAKGEARVASDRGFIFKPGYFPIINASELSDELSWEAPSLFSKTTKMYPIKIDNNIPVQTSSYTISSPIKEDLFAIPTEVCGAIDVTYNLKDSHLNARSNNTDLIASRRFFFASGSNKQKVSIVEQENNIAFYCDDDGETFKVGISVSEKAGGSGKPAHKFTIFTANVPSTESYLQPNIKCMTREDVSNSIFGKYGDSSPKLLISKHLKDNIGTFKETIPCANEHSTKLLNYIEKYIHEN